MSSTNKISPSSSKHFFTSLTHRLLQFTAKVHPKTAAESIIPALVAGRSQLMSQLFAAKDLARVGGRNDVGKIEDEIKNQLAIINEAIIKLSESALKQTADRQLLTYDTSRFLPLLQLLPLLKNQTQRQERFRFFEERRKARKQEANKATSDGANEEDDEGDAGFEQAYIKSSTTITVPTSQELKKMASNFVDYALSVQSPDFSIYVLRALYDEDVLFHEMLMIPSNQGKQSRIMTEDNNRNPKNNNSTELTLLSKTQVHRLLSSVVEKTNRMHSTKPYHKRIAIGELFSVLVLAVDETKITTTTKMNNNATNAHKQKNYDDLREEDDDYDEQHHESSIFTNKKTSLISKPKYGMKIIQPIPGLSSSTEKNNNHNENNISTTSTTTTTTTSTCYMENFLHWWHEGGTSNRGDNYPLSPTLETELSILAKRSMATLTNIKNHMALQHQQKIGQAKKNNNNNNNSFSSKPMLTMPNAIISKETENNIHHELLWNQQMPKNYILGLLMFLNETRSMEDVLQYCRWQLERQGFSHVYYLDESEREKAALFREEVATQMQEKARKRAQLENLHRTGNSDEQDRTGNNVENLKESDSTQVGVPAIHLNKTTSQPTEQQQQQQPRIHMSQVQFRAAVILSLRIARLAQHLPKDLIRQQRQHEKIASAASPSSIKTNENGSDVAKDAEGEEEAAEEIDDNEEDHEFDFFGTKTDENNTQNTSSTPSSSTTSSTFELIRGTTNATIVASMISLWIDYVKAMIHLDKQEQQQHYYYCQQQQQKTQDESLSPNFSHFVREFLTEINPRTLVPIIKVLKFYSSDKNQHVIRNTRAFHPHIGYRFDQVFKYCIEHFSRDFAVLTELACFHFGGDRAMGKHNFVAPREFFRVFDAIETNASKLLRLQPLSLDYKAGNNRQHNENDNTKNSNTENQKESFSGFIPLEDRKVLQRFFRRSYVLGFLSKAIDSGYLKFSVDDSNHGLSLVSSASSSSIIHETDSSKNSNPNETSAHQLQDSTLRTDEMKQFFRVEMRKKKLSRILQVLAEQLVMASSTTSESIILRNNNNLTENNKFGKSNENFFGVQHSSSASSLSAPPFQRKMFRHAADLDRFLKFFLKLQMEAPPLCYFALTVGIHETVLTEKINSAPQIPASFQVHSHKNNKNNNNDNDAWESDDSTSEKIQMAPCHTLLLDNLGRYMHLIGLGLHSISRFDHSVSTNNSSDSNRTSNNNNNGIEIASFKNRIHHDHAPPIISYHAIHKQIHETYNLLNTRMEETFHLRFQLLRSDENTTKSDTKDDHFYEMCQREIIKQGFSFVALIEYIHGHHIGNISLPGRLLHKFIGPFLINRIEHSHNNKHNTIALEFGRKLLLQSKIEKFATNNNRFETTSGAKSDQFHHHIFITTKTQNHHDLLNSFSQIIIPVITRGLLRGLSRSSASTVAVMDLLRAWDKTGRPSRSNNSNNNHQNDHDDDAEETVTKAEEKTGNRKRSNRSTFASSAAIYKSLSDSVIELFSRREETSSLERSDLLFQIYRQNNKNESEVKLGLSGKNSSLQQFLEKELELINNNNNSHDERLSRSLEGNFSSRWHEQFHTSLQILEDLSTRFIFSQFLLNRVRVRMEIAVSQFIMTSVKEVMKIRREIYEKQVKNQQHDVMHTMNRRSRKDDADDEEEQDHDVGNDDDLYQDHWNSKNPGLEENSKNNNNSSTFDAGLNKIRRFDHLAFSASSLNATQNNLLLQQQIEHRRLQELYRPQTSAVRHLLGTCLRIHDQIERARYETIVTTITKTTKEQEQMEKGTNKIATSSVIFSHCDNFIHSSGSSIVPNRFSQEAEDRERSQIIDLDLKLKNGFRSYFKAPSSSSPSSSSAAARDELSKTTTTTTSTTETKTRRMYHLARFRMRTPLQLLSSVLAFHVETEKEKNDGDTTHFLATSPASCASLIEVISLLPSFKLHQIILLYLQNMNSIDDINKQTMRRYYLHLYSSTKTAHIQQQEQHQDEENVIEEAEKNEEQVNEVEENESNNEEEYSVLLLPHMRRQLEISLAILERNPVVVAAPTPTAKPVSGFSSPSHSSPTSWVKDVTSLPVNDTTKLEDQKTIGNHNEDADYVVEEAKNIDNENKNDESNDKPVAIAPPNFTTSFSLSIMQQYHELKNQILNRINKVCEATIYFEESSQRTHNKDKIVASLRRQKEELVQLVEQLEKIIPKP